MKGYMKRLEASDLLQIWERGIGTAPSMALLPLLLAAFPEITPEQLPNLTIGARDSLLLTQREWLFGSRLEGVVSCPNCGEKLEFSLLVDELRADSGEGLDLNPRAPIFVKAAGVMVEVQIPTIDDAAKVASLEELLERCVRKVSKSGEDLTTAELSQGVIDAISRKIVKADPQADIRLSMECPACEHRWMATFDIVTYLWSEIHSWAQRMLFEVHQLASAYGWSEQEILALSPTRRQTYLSMIGE